MSWLTTTYSKYKLSNLVLTGAFLVFISACGGGGFEDLSNSGSGSGSNLPPVANAGNDMNLIGVNAISIYAQGTDADGQIVDWLWEQITGEPLVIQTSLDGRTISFTTPNLDDVYTFRLTVTDDDGATDSDEAVITITAGVVSLTVNYIKLDENGNLLSSDAPTWSCVKDSSSNLIWEIKTLDGGLHDTLKAFTWFDSNSKTNGDFAGIQNSANCLNSDCDSETFVKAVNESNLCGYSDWRLPTYSELKSLYQEDSALKINMEYFPNTQPTNYLTSDTLSEASDKVLTVDFGIQQNESLYKGDFSAVRLVREIDK